MRAYEKPSGIAHHAAIHHLACIFLTLSTAIEIIHAIIAITIPDTTMLTNVTFISVRTSLQGRALCDKL